MQSVVVTSDKTFSDIDALACSVAYRDFLIGKGFDAYAIINQNFNKSITDTILNWNAKLDTLDDIDKDEVGYVVVDRSDPIDFENFVDPGRVIEVFDHHLGKEDFWQKKIGKKSHIEFVGACATLIFEEIDNNKSISLLSSLSANLLLTAILAHTLNFNAQITTNRDIKAYEILEKIGKVDENWSEIYFSELEKGVLSDPKDAIINDIKEKNINGHSYIIGQNELWNSANFLEKNLSLITSILENKNNPNWFYTTPSISEGKNYLVAKTDKVKKNLELAIDASFDGDIGETDKLWLRKEIINKLSEI